MGEALDKVMLKPHLYGRQTMAVTEFQNGVGDQIIQQLQCEKFNENILKISEKLTDICMLDIIYSRINWEKWL